MTKEEKNKLYHLANDFDDNLANEAMCKLKEDNPTWHFCVEFDFLPVSNETSEWEFCYCFNDYEKE